MLQNRDHSPVDWRQVCSLATLVLGVAIIALSLIWTRVSTGRYAWSDKQALEYQAASSKLHSLSHEFAHQETSAESDALRPDLEAAQAHFSEVRAQLEAARQQPARIALILRLAGILIAVAGGTAYLTDKKS